MKRLREKLHSQRGASILLALLFFLVCILVSASVLMAAASNAGKLRSNYEEQQKYLALSSALQLVSGQLQEAKYTGKYNVCEWDVEETIIVDGEAKKITKHYFQVRQVKSKFTCGALTGTDADTVLDFTKELDGVFAKEFKGSGFVPLTGADVADLPAERELTVTVGGDGSTDELIKEKFPKVKVKVRMDKNRTIHLTATLTEQELDATGSGGKEYTMEAELSVAEPFKGMPTVEYSPGNRIPGTASGDGTPYTSPKDPDSVKWELKWIDKEVAADEG